MRETILFHSTDDLRKKKPNLIGLLWLIMESRQIKWQNKIRNMNIYSDRKRIWWSGEEQSLKIYQKRLRRVRKKRLGRIMMIVGYYWYCLISLAPMSMGNQFPRLILFWSITFLCWEVMLSPFGSTLSIRSYSYWTSLDDFTLLIML